MCDFQLFLGEAKCAEHYRGFQCFEWWSDVVLVCLYNNLLDCLSSIGIQHFKNEVIEAIGKIEAASAALFNYEKFQKMDMSDFAQAQHILRALKGCFTRE